MSIRPAARRLLRSLDLRRPIYRQTAAYEHFGRDAAAFTSKRTDRAALLHKDADVK